MHTETDPSPLRQGNESCLEGEFTQIRCGSVQLISTRLETLFRGIRGGFNHVVTVNAEIFFYAHEDPIMRELLCSTVNTVDGRVLQWICSLMYPSCRIRQMAGASFIYDLAEYCGKHGESMFLLGASEASNRGALRNLQLQFPNLRIDGLSPPFVEETGDASWNDLILAKIRRFMPVHLVVCFGPVKQERWIQSHKVLLEQWGVRCAYGMGGTLDFVAGTRRRAPTVVQKLGLEWLFRFFLEPRNRFIRTLRMFRMPFYAASTAERTIETCRVSKMHSVEGREI